jgi:hypothetical protein
VFGGVVCEAKKIEDDSSTAKGKKIICLWYEKEDWNIYASKLKRLQGTNYYRCKK